MHVQDEAELAANRAKLPAAAYREESLSAVPGFQLYDSDSTQHRITQVKDKPYFLTDGQIVNLSERPIYDKENDNNHRPVIATKNRLMLFPGAMEAHNDLLEEMKPRPIKFKGIKKNIGVTEEDPEFYMNFQMHPLASKWGKKNFPNSWFNKEKHEKGAHFSGFENPDFCGYPVHKQINTRHLQNLTNTELHAALESATLGGDFNHEEYLNKMGTMMRNTAIDESSQILLSEHHKFENDGAGVRSDPRQLEIINRELENEFKEVRALNDMLQHPSNLGMYNNQDETEHIQFMQDNIRAHEANQQWLLKESQGLGGIPNSYVPASMKL
jgi:hypothetical protein